MFVSVFTKTFRDQRRGLLGWSLGTALTVFVMAGIWPSFSGMDINSLLDQYPEAMKDVFNVADMATGAGYLNAELFSLMLPAVFVIYAVGRGARTIAGEEDEGTLDLLASMPVPRWRLLLDKAAALAVGVGVLSAVLFVATWLSSAVFGLGIPALAALNGALAMFLLGLEFGLVAVAVSAATGRRGVAVGVPAGLAGASYLVYLVAQLVDAWRPMRVISPVYQATSEGPIGPGLAPIAWTMLAVGVLALAGSVPVFEHRDLAV